LKPPRSAAGHDTPQARLPVNECFACGPDNPQGMHLVFTFDEEKRQAMCLFKLEKRFQGPPGHSHGGIIATILDEAMGKVNKLRSVIALTRSMKIEYLKPVPLGAPLLAVGTEVAVHGRQHHNAAEIRDSQGQVLARSEGIFIAVDPKRLAEKFQIRSAASSPGASSSKPLK
jgi:uncharacterized protein (TIGR00369 family)